MSRGSRSDCLGADLNTMPGRRWRLLQCISEARFLRSLEFNRSGYFLCVDKCVSLTPCFAQNSGSLSLPSTSFEVRKWELILDGDPP